MSAMRFSSSRNKELQEQETLIHKLLVDFKENKIKGTGVEIFLTGKDIMDIKNIKAGKMVGIIKKSLLTAVLENEVNNKEEAIMFVSKF